MFDEIYFIDTSVEDQEKIYDTIIEKLTNLSIDNNKTIYLRQVNSLNFSDNFYFEVFIRDRVVEHETLINPDFLIFLK